MLRKSWIVLGAATLIGVTPVLALTSEEVQKLLASDGAAFAAPGDLDETFGVGGVVRTDVDRIDSPSDLVIQPDGKIVAAGFTTDSIGNRKVLVARYLPNGALDADFGAEGIVVPNRNHGLPPRLALQSDGKIVLATRGSPGGSVFVYRFGADGTPDSSFGISGDGTAQVLPPSDMGVSGVTGVGVLADGKVVVALRASPRAGGAVVAFARFNSDGTSQGWSASSLTAFGFRSRSRCSLTIG